MVIIKKEVIGHCPICNSSLQVSKLNCRNCHTSLEGSFELSKFDYLNTEQKFFLEIFIKNRGNIKEIEKDLGISYPTVRKNLDSIILALGYNLTNEEDESANRKELLDKVGRGEISADEAVELMNKKG